MVSTTVAKETQKRQPHLIGKGGAGAQKSKLVESSTKKMRSKSGTNHQITKYASPTNISDNKSTNNSEKCDRNSLFFSPSYKPLKIKNPSPTTATRKTIRRKLILDQVKITHFADIKIASSGRVPTTQKTIVQQKQIEECIKNSFDDGIEVFEDTVKGRGLKASRAFEKDEFVVEYIGDLISKQEALEREQIYDEKPEKYGSYMFYIDFENKKYCIDATKETDKLGRLINHSHTKPNLKTQLVSIDGEPRLIFVAKRDLQRGEELLYDYNDRRKHVLDANPWLKC